MYSLLMRIWPLHALVICIFGGAHILGSYFSVAHFESVAYILFVHTMSFGAHAQAQVVNILVVDCCDTNIVHTKVIHTCKILHTFCWCTNTQRHTGTGGAQCTFWWLTAVTQTDHFPRRSLTLPFLLVLHNNSLSVSYPNTRLSPPTPTIIKLLFLHLILSIRRETLSSFYQFPKPTKLSILTTRPYISPFKMEIIPSKPQPF